MMAETAMKAAKVKLTEAEGRVLKVLSEHEEPLYNGTLGALTGLKWNSAVFYRLENRKLIVGSPAYKITAAGREALASPHPDTAVSP